MFRMYGNYQFKLDKDYYENINNGNFFQLTKKDNTQTYIVSFFKKDGNKVYEKKFIAKDNKFEKILSKIVDKYEVKYEA